LVVDPLTEVSIQPAYSSITRTRSRDQFILAHDIHATTVAAMLSTSDTLTAKG
jgi:hypothetical protein